MVTIHFLLLANGIYVQQIYGAMLFKKVCHWLEGDNDSLGGRAQRKWALMRNNKSSLLGIMAKEMS